LPTQHRAFEFLGYTEGSFPVAERIGRTGLHFGVHQYLTEDDLEYAAGSVNEYFA
jgi:dTDP-4-amino-4,6-dideoxygalactose transaminase